MLSRQRLSICFLVYAGYVGYLRGVSGLKMCRFRGRHSKQFLNSLSIRISPS